MARELTRTQPATIETASSSAAQYQSENRAPRTRQAYAEDCARFATWCTAQRVDVLPAAPSTVAAYVAALADAGRAIATIERALAAISSAHVRAGFPSPRHAGEVRETMAGIRRAPRVQARRRGPKRALVGDAIVRLCDTWPDTRRGTRNRALVLLGWHAALRPSELVGLDVEHVTDDGEGGLWLLLPRSKTDQEGHGARVHVPKGPAGYCAVRTLRRWLLEATIESGPVFRPVDAHGAIESGRLTTRSLARLVKTAAKRAGLDPADYAGHSLRSGLVTSAAIDGAGSLEIMQKTRHRSDRMVRRYLDEAAAMYRDVADGLLRPLSTRKSPETL